MNNETSLREERQALVPLSAVRSFFASFLWVLAMLACLLLGGREE